MVDVAVTWWSQGASNPTLTNSGKTITWGGTGAEFTFAKATKVFTTGEIYWEVNIDSLTSVVWSNAGICQPWNGQNNLAIGWRNDNVGSTAKAGTYAAGDVLCFALSFANGKYWVRKNGGSWNGSGTDDPATNTGGYSLSAFAGLPFCIYVGTVNNSAQTINGGNFAAFAQTIPSGFTAADSVSGSLMFDYPSFTNVTEFSPSLSSNELYFGGGNLIPYRDWYNGNFAVAITNSLFNAGKLYYEAYVSKGVNGMIGLTSAGATVSHGLDGVGQVGWDFQGIFRNITGGTTGGGWNNPGTILRVCIDFTNQKWWVANSTGYWNNVNTADPATNTGGLDLSSLIASSALGSLRIAMSSMATRLLHNFGSMPFIFSVPSGFSAVDSATPVVLPLPHYRISNVRADVVFTPPGKIRITRVAGDVLIAHKANLRMSQVYAEVCMQMTTADKNMKLTGYNV